MSGPRFLTLAEIADELSTTKAQVYALVRSGALTAIQIGGRHQWRVERARFEDYIDQLYKRSDEARPQLPTELPPEED